MSAPTAPKGPNYCRGFKKPDNVPNSETDSWKSGVEQVIEATRKVPGWYWVPSTPTPEMIEAATQAQLGLGSMADILKAALEAAAGPPNYEELD